MKKILSTCAVPRRPRPRTVKRVQVWLYTFLTATLALLLFPACTESVSDARQETVSRIRQLGFRAEQGDFMKMKFEGQLDVLSMMDVLEHIPYPRDALSKAAQLLRPGGVAYDVKSVWPRDAVDDRL